MAPIALPDWLKVKDEAGKEQRACGVEIGMSGLRLSGGCMHADTPDAHCSWRTDGICAWHTSIVTPAALVAPPVAIAAPVAPPVPPVAIVAPVVAAPEPTKPNVPRQVRKKH